MHVFVLRTRGQVLANELHSRFQKVWLITSDESTLLVKPDEDADIERALIQAVGVLHVQFIAHQDNDASGNERQGLGLFSGHHLSTAHVYHDHYDHRYRHFRLPFKRQLECVHESLREHQHEIAAILLGGALSVLIHLLQRKMLI